MDDIKIENRHGAGKENETHTHSHKQGGKSHMIKEKYRYAWCIYAVVKKK